MTTQQDLHQKWMDGFEVVYGDETESQEQGSFHQVMEKTQTKNFVEGEVFEGQVVSITDEFVMVDIGYKQEGIVYSREFRNYDGTLKVKQGDKIEVYRRKPR